MAVPANVAVRQGRRRSTPLELERMNVMKALTAAEHSRRQFILNFAASRDTQLLVPGQKSAAVKAAEEWVAAWLSQEGYESVNNEYFKFNVDAQLWSTHVGNDLDFPFAFMRGKSEATQSDTSSQTTEKTRRKSDVFLNTQEVDLRNGEIISLAPAAEPKTRSPKNPQRSAPSTPQTRRQRSAKAAEVPDKKRSLSLNSIDDLKPAKIAQDKSPFLKRLSRSWSRRMSSIS